MEEPDVHTGPLAAAKEAAQILGVSRQRLTQLTAQPEFPAPYDRLSVGAIWLADDLRVYAATRRTKRGPRTPAKPHG